MVRTKHGGGVKSKGAKALKKSSITSSSSKSKNKRDSSLRGGGNPLCPRETPHWQKPITKFFDNSRTDSLLDERHNMSLQTVDEQGEREVIPAEFCSAELNDSIVLDDTENKTAANNQNDSITLINNVKRKNIRDGSESESLYSEDDIPTKRIKLSSV